MKKRNQRTKKSHKSVLAAPNQQTFMDHARELRGRLFAVSLAFLAIGGAAYPFFDKIVGYIVAPLSDKQELVYLTPGGAFGFMIQVCVYVGIIGALPVIIYQLYQFIMPAVQKVKLKQALRVTIASVILALVGVVFAYVVSLPAALYFLTSFDLYHISAMLTIDSYLSFVMTYLLAGALLFQLPLVMFIIDSIKPLKPRRLMKYQDKMILGSFIVAAIISPTPDALNQALLASPLVVMYQLGIVMLWIRHRKDKEIITVSQPAIDVARPAPALPIIPVQRSVSAARPSYARSVDGMMRPVKLKSTGTLVAANQKVTQVMPRQASPALSASRVTTGPLVSDWAMPATHKKFVRLDSVEPLRKPSVNSTVVYKLSHQRAARSIDGLSLTRRSIA